MADGVDTVILPTCCECDAVLVWVWALVPVNFERGALWYCPVCDEYLEVGED